MNVLFVDLEDVCRSPLAAGLLKKKYNIHKLKGKVDSAGFESFNINEPPDKRVTNVAEQNGLSLTGKARIFTKNDFQSFDVIYVMDTVAYNKVADLSTGLEQMRKVDFILNLLPEHPKNDSIPNPFYNGVTDCQNIYNLLDKATDQIIEKLIKPITN